MQETKVQETKVQTKTIDYQDGDTQLEGYVAFDETISGPRPAVLIAHDWTGRRDFATGKAEEIAGLGYVGFALDMYGKGVFGADGDVEGTSPPSLPIPAPAENLRRLIEDLLT